MPRELLKFRKGDVGLKIAKDGKLEVAGVTPDMPMIDSKGNVNPALLFAAAWARKNQKVFEVLVQNFKDSVKEGIFGQDAQEEFIANYRSRQQEETKGANIEPSVQPVQVKPPPPFLNPDTKPTVAMPVPTPDATFDTSLGNEFETMADAASGAVTLTDGGCGNADSASGAVTFEKPAPLTAQGMVAKRDGKRPMTVEDQLREVSPRGN
jgi:hypothetical protein